MDKHSKRKIILTVSDKNQETLGFWFKPKTIYFLEMGLRTSIWASWLKNLGNEKDKANFNLTNNKNVEKIDFPYFFCSLGLSKDQRYNFESCLRKVV